jgi:hypothetical protein
MAKVAGREVEAYVVKKTGLARIFSVCSKKNVRLTPPPHLTACMLVISDLSIVSNIQSRTKHVYCQEIMFLVLERTIRYYNKPI